MSKYQKLMILITKINEHVNDDSLAKSLKNVIQTVS